MSIKSNSIYCQNEESYKNRMSRLLRDPVSCLTHLFGFLAAIPIFITMVFIAAQEHSALKVIAISVFGISLLLLYGASSLYHAVKVSDNTLVILRRIDHMMIFILIAGTYTPVCLISLTGAWGWTLFILVWSMAIAGIVLKAFWLEAPRFLSTAIYVIMGWLVLIAFVPLSEAIPVSGIALLVAGGVSYTLGAVIYGLKRPKFHFRYFGFHEIFHLFVLGGSLFHILFMYLYVL